MSDPRPTDIWNITLDDRLGLDIGDLPKAGTIYPRDSDHYWSKRRNDRIYLMTIIFTHYFCRKKSTIADIGCYVSPLVLMVPDFKVRFAIDPSHEARLAWEGVDGATFVQSAMEDVDPKALTGEDRFDLVMCHQVIEHLEDPPTFVAGLARLARRVILSTTFETPAGIIPGHVQDPISLDMFESWLPSRPISTLISRGPVGGKILTVF